MPITTRSQQREKNTQIKTHSMQLRKGAKPQYKEEKETEETEIEMKRNDLIQYLKSESHGKMVILSEAMRARAQKHEFKKHLIAFGVPYANTNNIQMISNGVNVIPKFLVTQVWDNMDDMYVEDARVFFQDIYSVGGALMASFAALLAKEDYNDECVEYLTVVASSAITNMEDKPLIGSILSLKRIGNLDKKYGYVYCESISDDRAPANNVKNIRCIFVSHLDSGILKEGSTIDEAIRAAQQAGVRSGYVSFNDIQRVVAVGRDKVELEKALSLVIVKKDCKSEKKKNEQFEDALDADYLIWQDKTGKCIRSHLNHNFLRARPVPLKAITTPGTLFRRGGRDCQAYSGVLNRNKCVQLWGAEYVTSFKLKGSHMGWTFEAVSLEYEWDSFCQDWKMTLHVEADDPLGNHHRA